jgi:nucleoside-diphosphate-sugar epimerase
MQNVVITGPTGSIGMALIQELLSHDMEVLALVHPGSKRIGSLPKDPNLQILALDLNDLERLPSMVEKKYDVFYHLGWGGTTGSARNDLDIQMKNIEASITAARAAASIGCKRFVGAGSQAEYGRYEGVLTAETPAFPENGYGMAKLATGQMTRLECEKLGLDHIWTRILSIYGPYDGLQSMVNMTIGKLLNGECPELTAGEQIWDYLYSKDAGLAMFLLGQKGKPGKTYCLGSGQPRPLRDYITEIRDLTAPEAELGFGRIPYGPRQVMHLTCDIRPLQEDCGFRPRYSFHQGIQETLDWYRSLDTKSR